jgi:hypothetical protein
LVDADFRKEFRPVDAADVDTLLAADPRVADANQKQEFGGASGSANEAKPILDHSS